MPSVSLKAGADDRCGHDEGDSGNEQSAEKSDERS
jgi:hypothetical protein